MMFFFSSTLKKKKKTLINERRRTEGEAVLLTLEYFLFTYIILQDFNSVLFFREKLPVWYRM